VIGYYYAYSEHVAVGLCQVEKWPSLRRTCILDMTGAVMAVMVAFVIMLFEFVSAYINRRDVSSEWFAYYGAYRFFVVV